jgi:DNA-binding transcriptional MerR regulator
MSGSMLTIGELASRAGVATSALRYWEECGLLPAVERIAGHRRYPESAVEMVGLILLLSDVGFSLAEQKALIASRSAAPGEWRQLVQLKLADLNDQIAKAEVAREIIEHGLQCPHDDVADCPSFTAVVAARLARLPLREAHPRSLLVRHGLQRESRFGVAV